MTAPVTHSYSRDSLNKEARAAMPRGAKLIGWGIQIAGGDGETNLGRRPRVTLIVEYSVRGRASEFARVAL